MPVGEVVTIFANGAKVFQGEVYTRSPVVGISDLPPGHYTFYTSSMSAESSTAAVNILPSTRGSAGDDLIASPLPDFALYGLAGNDTLVASAGADFLVGGEGADTFAWAREPWAPATVKDFTVGVDRLDLGALLKGASYSGADPVVDGRITLLAQGGDTLVLFDDDGAGGDWPNYILKLEGVFQPGLGWGQLSGGTSPPPPATAGQVINSQGPGSTLQGGGADDTLTASQGADVLTGGGGGDVFAYKALPWSAGRITDFTLGSDRLDLSVIFQSAGYTGSDPATDGRMRFDSDGVGGTRVYFDRDAPNGGDWPFLITTLEGVSPAGLTWGQLAGSGPGPPPPVAGLVINSRGPGSTLAGGAGADTLVASQGGDTLTGGAGDDWFSFLTEPWSPVLIKDFDVGDDLMDLRLFVFSSNYGGDDLIGAGYVTLTSDGRGGTNILFDRDLSGPTPLWPNYIIRLEGVSPAEAASAQLFVRPSDFPWDY